MASDIRSMLTAQQVAEHYGFEVNRSGFMKCPFHTGDRTASLKLYDERADFIALAAEHTAPSLTS